MRLQEYNFSIEYIKGNDNVIADALSRIPWVLKSPEGEIVSQPSLEYNFSSSDSESDQPIWIGIEKEKCKNSENVENLENLENFENSEIFEDLENDFEISLPLIADQTLLTLDEIKKEQGNDVILLRIFNWVDNATKPDENQLAGTPDAVRVYVEMFDNLQIKQGVLGVVDFEDPLHFKIIIPSSLVELVLKQFHEGVGMAHEGFKKVFMKISRVYYWPGLKQDLKLYVASCPTCDRFRARRTKLKNPLHHVRVGNRGEVLAMDLVGGKETLLTTDTGCKYILVMIDLFTRFVVATPLPNMNAQTIVDAVETKWFLVFDRPRRILTDRGANFESAVFSNFCTLNNIVKSRTTAYHPQSNGACERVNQTIKKGLQKLLNNQNLEKWDTVLPYVVSAYNSTVHSSTQFTPHFLLFGKEKRFPREILVGRPETDPTSAAYAMHHQLN